MSQAANPSSIIHHPSPITILVVRFRQLGDAVLTTVLLNTLRDTFPDARIDYVLDERIAPLFEHHPSIDNIITFSREERHRTLHYLRKVWRIMHNTRYDIIIDKRSTLNTTPFALFSLHTPIRVALEKPYTRWIYNYRVSTVGFRPMIDHILDHIPPTSFLASHLPSPITIKYNRHITLGITQQEKDSFHDYLLLQGLDLQRPIALIGVTAKLAEKTWPKQQMTEVIRRMIEKYPQLQLIFNYAPGKEEENARDIYQQLGSPSAVFIDVKAKSSRELAAMCDSITFYFGNEGGARHIVHAMGKPSLVVCSPHANPKVWIPVDDIPAVAIENSQATTDNVWQQLEKFITHHLSPITHHLKR